MNINLLGNHMAIYTNTIITIREKVLDNFAIIFNDRIVRLEMLFLLFLLVILYNLIVKNAESRDVALAKPGDDDLDYMTVNETEANYDDNETYRQNFETKDKPNFISGSTYEETQSKFVNKQEDFIFTTDWQGYVNYTNNSLLNLFDMNINEIIGESIFVVYEKLGLIDRSWFEELNKKLKAYNIIRIERENIIRWVLFNYEANLDLNGNVNSINAVGHDITEIINSNKDNYKDASIDYLTGLYNQQGFYEKISQLKDVKKAIAFFVNIINFTEINNYYGHTIGDSLIVAITNQLKNVVDNNCLIGRFSEDRFVVFCSDIDCEECKPESYLDKFRRFISSTHVIENSHIQLDKCIGYSVYPEDTNDLDSLFSLASIAMKEALMTHSTEIIRYSDDMHDKLEYNVIIGNKLRHALDNDLIQVYFQKAIDCKDNQVYFLEELSRWQDKDYGFISPDEFFRIAYETKLLGRLDRYMVRKAVAAFKEVREKYNIHNSKLTVNIAPTTLLDQTFGNYLDKVVESSKIDKKQVVVEISEGTFVHNLDLCIERIKDYKNKGYLIALDDFGKEYSSLAILDKVDFDIIKIDALFTQNITEMKNQEIVKMIRRITRISKKEIVAEGVETALQSEILKTLGCSIQQGYFLHKPENLLK